MMQAFAVRVQGCDHETLINCRSAGKAKSAFLDRLDLPEIKYTDLRCRRLGGPVTTEDLARTAKYRGVPFVRAGMRIQVGEDFGRIVGSNASANFDVEFETGRWTGETLNCHPNWMTTYFDDSGNVLAKFA